MKKTFWQLVLSDGRGGCLWRTKKECLAELPKVQSRYPELTVEVCTVEMSEREYKKLPEFDGY